MKLGLEPNNVFMEFPCECCGNHYEAGSAIAALYDDEGQHLGYMCPQCVEAGADGIKERIKQHIKHHQDQIQRLESLLKQDFDVPTIEQWRECEERCDRELAGNPDDKGRS